MNSEKAVETVALRPIVNEIAVGTSLETVTDAGMHY